MLKPLVFTLALLAFPLAALAQSTTASGQSQTQNQVTIQNLPPAASCFTCDCNTADVDCRTDCFNSYSDLVKRQQCEATCGRTLATCLSNAQRLQRAVDEQRALTQQNASSARTN